MDRRDPTRVSGWAERHSAALRTFLLVMLCALGAVRLVGAGTLTLDDRLVCQRAIERVYWEHRMWPETNPGERTPFEASVPDAIIRRKVEDGLLASAALAELWLRPVTGTELQAELDRMARGTRRPEILRELFDALGGDARLAAECLARPRLAKRMLRRWFESDERLHREARERAELALTGVSGSADLRWIDGDYSELELVADDGPGKTLRDPTRLEDGRSLASEGQWLRGLDFLAGAFELSARVATTGADEVLGLLPVHRVSALREGPDRYYVVAVLEKSPGALRVAHVEWPKLDFDVWWRGAREALQLDQPELDFVFRLPDLPAGGCQVDSWRPTRAPLRAYTHQTAVWTGSEMLVWGGFPFREDLATYGGRYDPATDSWELIGTWNAPSSRGRHSAVWTGSEMIVWGGEAEGLAASNEGGRYDPVSNTWRALPTTDAPSPRYYHSAVWSGGEMIVWGGCTDAFCDVYAASGGRYDPLANAWESTTTGGAPAGRYGHGAVWTGSRMVVWGGWTGSSSTATGGVYDPLTDSWSATEEGGAPAARFFPSATWAGNRMIVWGGNEGEFATVWLNSGGLYDPVSDSWTAMTTSGAPSGRDGHAAVWSGSELIVWGGYDGSTETDSGARYDPNADSWSPISGLNAPSGRTIPAAVWTGSEMLLWGGIGTTGGGLANGGRYDPVTDSWVPVGVPTTPSERTFHSSVWTGVELVVWAGCGVFVACPTNTGGIYDSITDTWRPTSLAGAPSDRFLTNHVWTGTEMLVWGGCPDPYCGMRLNSGGRFDPVSETWSPISTANAPSPRFYHDGVWTGTEMIVWGGCGNEDCTDTTPPHPRDGGRYNPVTDTWTPTNEADAPNGRWFLTTTWTGGEMIVWGGEDMDVGRLNTGWRYAPSTDTWTPMTVSGAPEPRSRHRAHWTGDRLIVWGGNDAPSLVFNTGGLYDPLTDSWSPTSTTGALSPRAYPYTAWTGAEMLIWGGFCDNTPECSLNDGAFYDPATEVWRGITPVEAPLGRADLWGPVWTGSEMMLFGGTWPATLQELRTGGVYCAGESTPQAIFADGFESGDLTGWSFSLP